MSVWKLFVSKALTAVVLLTLVGTSSHALAQEPNLLATKSNDAGTSVEVFSSFQWDILVENVGLVPATFTNEEVILRDNLPPGALYGDPVEGVATNVTNANLINCGIVSNTLECIAGGNVTFGISSKFPVTILTTATSKGPLVNPTGGICRVDPDETIMELNDDDNDCRDSVAVSGKDVEFYKTVIGGTASPGDFTFNIGDIPQLQGISFGTTVFVPLGPVQVTENGPAGYAPIEDIVESGCSLENGIITLEIDSDFPFCYITNEYTAPTTDDRVGCNN